MRKVTKSFLQICQTVYPFYILFTVSDCVQLRAIDVGVACLAQRHSGGRTRAQTYLTPINPPLSYILLALHIAQAYLTHIYPLLSTYIRHRTLQKLNSALSTPWQCLAYYWHCTCTGLPHTYLPSLALIGKY